MTANLKLIDLIDKKNNSQQQPASNQSICDRGRTASQSL